jgi:trehalose 6-phosphate synthase
MQRLGGFRVLLERHEEWRRQVTMLQIAAESRKDVASYQALRAALDSEAGSLNAELGEADWQPLRIVSRGVDRSTVAGFMRLAHVGLVTPLRDGMNLVAKEYVAAQDPADPGVLLLSRFAGAAETMRDALIVNPYDIDGTAEAIQQALRMPLDERRVRHARLLAGLRAQDVHWWAQAFLTALQG